jgi:hypothetical protein
MVRDPWTLAAALFAFGVIGWVVVAERPPKSPVRIEAARTLAADPDLRLVSELSPYRPDNVRLSDLEERFVCTVCGHRDADVRILWPFYHRSAR